LITKRTYRFNLESESPYYRGESINNFRISGCGFIEDYGGKNSLEIELKEEGQRIPMSYQVWLIIEEKGGPDKQLSLGNFHSVEEKIIKWQTIFSPQDIGAPSYSLEQVSAITIKAIPKESDGEMTEQNTYFISNQLGSPEIEIILEEDELEKILEPLSPEEIKIEEGFQLKDEGSPFIEEELLEDLETEDRIPEQQEKAEWEKVLEKILAEPEEEVQITKEEKKAWKIPQPIAKQEEIIDAPKLKITFN